jgi:hypothetical protein
METSCQDSYPRNSEKGSMVALPMTAQDKYTERVPNGLSMAI